MGQTELVAHRECDEAQSGLGDDPEALSLLLGVKADARDIQCAQAVRTDQQTCNQVCGDRRQMKKLG